MDSQLAWESHKSTIRHLYLSEDKPLKLVIDVMANSYGFVASKSQYERQLKKWQFRKNLKNGEWKAIHLHLSKRKREDKESDLYVDGILVPKSKVQKETSRNSFLSLAEQYAQAQTPEIPSGISICTPAALGEDEFQVENLPWFRFESFLQLEAFRAVEANTPDPFLVGSYDGFIVWNGSPQPMTWGNLLERTVKVPEEVRLGIVTWVSNTRNESSTASAEAIKSKLISMMPELRFGEHSASAMKLLGPINRATTLQIMKLLVYMLSNNLPMPSQEFEGKIIRWLHLEENFRTLEYLISIPGPTTEALAEALFRSACRAEDIKIVKTLIDYGLTPNEQVIEDEFDLYTPMQYASFQGNLELAHILVEAGSNVNTSAGERTALQLAASQETPELVKLLLANGARVNELGILGRPALHEAVSVTGNNETVQILLYAGANLECEDKNGATALHGAVRGGDIEVVLTLLRAGANTNPPLACNETILEIAIDCGRTQMVRVLLDAGARCFGSALALAATHESETGTQLVQILLDAGASVDELSAHGRTALTEAALKNNVKLAQLLIVAGADVDGRATKERHRKLKTPLQSASFHEAADLAQILLHAGADVNVRGGVEDWTARFPGTALQIAARCGNTKLVQILLDAGANVNAPATEKGFTALQAAVQTEDMKLVQILLDAGADVNVPATEEGCTALQAAVQTGDITLVQILLDAGAYINCPAADKGGRTALQAAIEGGNHLIIKSILEAGADIDGVAAKINGITALTAAIHTKDTKLIYTLLNAGADVNNPSEKLWGETALEAAAANNDIHLVRYLLGIGAEPNDPFALLAAVKNRNVEMLRILLAADAFLDRPGMKKYGSVALGAAVELGDLDLVRMLSAAGMDLNAPVSSHYGRYREDLVKFSFMWYPQTPLERAIRKEDLSMVRFLLDAGADPNSRMIRRSWNYDPMLYQAVGKGNASITRTLIDAGADIGAFSGGDFGRNPLQLAAQRGEMELVRILLKAGANVNAPPANKGGVTALQAAAIGGYYGIACVLLQANADVNAPPAKEHGRTALEGAAEHGRIDMLQLLLNAGAGIEGAGRAQYDRALRFAAENGYNAAARLLRAYHASR